MQNLANLTLVVVEILFWASKLKMGYMTLITFLLRVICHLCPGT